MVTRRIVEHFEMDNMTLVEVGPECVLIGCQEFPAESALGVLYALLVWSTDKGYLLPGPASDELLANLDRILEKGQPF